MKIQSIEKYAYTNQNIKQGASGNFQSSKSLTNCKSNYQPSFGSLVIAGMLIAAMHVLPKALSRLASKLSSSKPPKPPIK